MKQVQIFTDGSCTLNDNGRGGYGAVIVFGSIQKEIYGGYTRSTNNRMELMACIKALEALKEPCEVIVYSDSKYIVDAMNKKWIVRWFAKDFEDVKNPDLWKELVRQMGRHKVSYVWIKGHSGVPLNERADELAAIGASLPDLIKDTRC